MKKIYNNIVLSAILIVGFVQTSCNDEPDKFELSDGLPTIEYVRFTDPEEKENHIDKAKPGSTICIVGDNLRSTYELYFNDQKALLNNSYITNNSLIVSVPDDFPKNVTNKIYLVNKDKDTVDYDFNVIFPAPVIHSLTNEYAQAGTLVTMYGNYFVSSDNNPLVIKIGELNVSDIEEVNQNSVKFKIPQGATSNYIEATTVYGTSKSSFKYKEDRGILFDFDDDGDGALSKGNGWHVGKVGDFDDVNSIDGSYLKFQGKLDNKFTWDDANFAFEYWPAGSTELPDLNTLVDFSDLSNLELKFEVNVPNPWSVCAMQIFLTSSDIVSDSNKNTTYYGSPTFPRALWIPWQTTGTFSTKEWVTVSVPLSDFKYDKDGKEISPLSDNNITGLTLFVYNGGIDGVACEPTICIDNIRVVPKL